MKYFFPRRKLTANEFLIIPEAIGELLLARIKVSFLPSRKYLPVPCRNNNIFPSQEKIKKGETIAFVVNGLSIRTPWSSTCLVKVLAAHKILARRRIRHTLYCGVKKNTSTGFDAHAWLSINNEVIIGDTNLHFFKEIFQITV